MEEHEDNAFKYADEYIEERGKYKLNQTLDYNSLSYSPSLDYPLEIEGEVFYPGGSKQLYNRGTSEIKGEKEMNNELFAAFGITEEDIKKETTTKKKDTSGTGKTKKSEKKTEYELPLEFCGGFWHNRFPGEGKIGKKKLLEFIAEEIRELSGMITDFEIIAAAKKEDKEQDVSNESSFVRCA